MKLVAPIYGVEMKFTDNLNVVTIKSIFANLLHNASWKALLSTVLVSFNWVFQYEKEGLLVIFLLIGVDTITGFLSAFKENDLQSGKFFRVCMKCFIYFTLIGTSALVDKVLPLKFAATMTMTFLGMTEGISVFENLNKLGKFPVIGLITSTLRDKLKNHGKK